MTWRDAQKDPPPFGQPVIVMHKTSGVVPGMRAFSNKDGDFYAIGDESGLEGDSYSGVTHWMPLPDPPETGA